MWVPGHRDINGNLKADELGLSSGCLHDVPRHNQPHPVSGIPQNVHDNKAI